jgi:hypothetical protein
MSRILSQRLGQSQAESGANVGVYETDADGFEYESEDSNYSYAPSVGPAVAGNIPSRRRRAAASMENQYNNPQAPQPKSFGSWFSSLNILQRIQLAVLILLIIFVVFVVAPLSLLSLLQGTSVARGAELTSTRSNLLSAINAVYAVGSYELASKDKNLAEALAMADKAVPATPTYTPGPTFTPIPTGTPLPTATSTPEPTATTAPTAAPFIQQFIPEPAAPVAAPAESKVVEVAQTLKPVAWDGRLDQLGVNVAPAQVEPGQPYWRLIEARWADEQQSGGKHHIYVEVLDENGARIVGHPVTVWWGDGSYTSGVEDKAPPDYGFNYQMYAAGYAYSVKVEGLPSEILQGAGMGDIERREWGIHTSFYLIYQKTTR